MSLVQYVSFLNDVLGIYPSIFKREGQNIDTHIVARHVDLNLHIQVRHVFLLEVPAHDAVLVHGDRID